MRKWPFFTRHPLFTPCLTISLQTLLTAVLRGHSSPALCSLLPSEHTTPRAPGPPGTHVNTTPWLASCRPELGCMHQAPAALPNCPCTLVCQGTCGTAPIVGYNGQAGIRDISVLKNSNFNGVLLPVGSAVPSSSTNPAYPHPCPDPPMHAPPDCSSDSPTWRGPAYTRPSLSYTRWPCSLQEKGELTPPPFTSLSMEPAKSESQDITVTIFQVFTKCWHSSVTPRHGRVFNWVICKDFFSISPHTLWCHVFPLLLEQYNNQRASASLSFPLGGLFATCQCKLATCQGKLLGLAAAAAPLN